MKKLFAILLVVAATVAAAAVTSSCQKDINNAKALIGTKWAGAADGNAYVITFKTQTEFEMSETGTLNNKIYKGTFIITGNQASLKGSLISLTFDADWTHDWKTGEFVSETEFRLGAVPFAKVK